MGRIRAFQVVLVLAIVALGATALVSVRGANHYLERVQLSREQADAMAELAIRANRFSEQIAELLLIGEPERGEFEDARGKLLGQLDILRQLSAKDDDLVADPDNDAEEKEEASRLDRMRALIRQIDRAVERLLLLQQQDRRDEAVQMFRAEIENRFDKEFETLVAEAVADERDDVTEADGLAKRFLSGLLVVSLVALGALLALAVVSTWLFARSLRRPIDVLVEGARAIEQGRLGHRIPYARHDEFGVLARRFDAMSEKLEEQRGELLSSRATLERQVAERTREIAEANAQLTELDRQRVRFFGDISHELKTPLTVLRAEAEVALRGAAKSETAYRAALENIVAQSAELGDLVDDLLFLARAEADSVRFEFKPVSLDEAVAQAVQDASLLSELRRIRITCDVPTPAPVVRADPRRLKQALLVMLDNAARYAEEGTEVSVRVATPEPGRAAISVTDRGPGIPPDEAPFVFDRFFRGSHAVASGTGSGLGLPIARWIVMKHDGEVDLSSVPGQGTEVRLSLPLAA